MIICIWSHIWLKCCSFLAKDLLCPRRESNPHLTLRTGLFYPLNYQGYALLYQDFLDSQNRIEFGFEICNLLSLISLPSLLA